MPQDQPRPAAPERESAVILVQIPKDRVRYAVQAIEALLSFAGVPHATRTVSPDAPLPADGADTAEATAPVGAACAAAPSPSAASPRRNARTAFLEVVHPNIGPGDALRELRRSAGLSQAELARRAGLRGRGDVAALERGERTMDEETAVRVGAALQADVSFFPR